MAKTKKDVGELFEAFKLEISRIEAKKHKTEADITHLGATIKNLEKQHQVLNKQISALMTKSAEMDGKRLNMGTHLSKLTGKLEKLRILYADLKEV